MSICDVPTCDSINCPSSLRPALGAGGSLPITLWMSSNMKLYPKIITYNLPCGHDGCGVCAVVCHRDARVEAEALRQRLAAAEARATQLHAENQTLRARLGDTEPTEAAPSAHVCQPITTAVPSSSP